MYNSRTHRRSAAGLDEGEEPVASPSMLELLFSYLSDGVARSAMRRVNRGVRQVVHWTLPRVIAAWIGAAILTGGILLLLGAGVKGLEALQCPLWLSYLLTGAAAVLIALVAMKGILWPKSEAAD